MKEAKMPRSNAQFIQKKTCLNICILIVLFLSFSISCFSASLEDNYPRIERVEKLIFGKSFPERKVSERLRVIEKSIFGKTYLNDSLDKRTERINSYVLGNGDVINQSTKVKNNDYENTIIKELNNDEFIDQLFGAINEERSLKGLVPLSSDPLAMRVASDQSVDLIKNGYLSYYNSKNQCPDERYTLAGGTGATVEIVKGFELDQKIKLSNLLLKQLIQALISTQDDSNVFFSPYITHIGCGYSLSTDKKKFVSVIEFITKGGEFEPIKPVIKLGEKLDIRGVVNSPFKFKAVSIAYFDMDMMKKLENGNADSTFDNEDLIPYFPPQDYIAFTDTAKSNFLNVLKGIGIVGAIAGSPFTGGATAILAPALLSSIQNGPPREIPLKHGIKVRGNKFSGEIDLNHQSMTGLYFVSVLGELPNINYPIVISRRTVRVESPLVISKYKLHTLQKGV